MVDWISPGYPGDEMEFQARFLRPIEKGSYMTSTAEERRNMLNRAESSCLASSVIGVALL